MNQRIFSLSFNSAMTRIVAVMPLLVGCATNQVGQDVADGPPDNAVDISQIQDAVPRVEPLSRGGNPENYEQWGKQYKVLKSSKGYVKKGIASWYGTKFHGRKTANGEFYDMFGMTAAHRTLPLPTYLKVKNLENNNNVIVRVNDRGPFHDDRIIDLSYAAAAKLDMHKEGTAHVEISAIDPEQDQQDQPAHTKTIMPLSDPLFVQIGAFQDLFNAARVRDDLDSPKLPPLSIKATRDDANLRLYRVQFGPFYTFSEAQQVVRLLTEKGFLKSRLISGSVNMNSAMLQ